MESDKKGYRPIPLKPNERMWMVLAISMAFVIGFITGISFPESAKLNITSTLTGGKFRGDLSVRNTTDPFKLKVSDIGGNFRRDFLIRNASEESGQTTTDPFKIWVPSNPKGAERLPPNIIESQSDLFPRRLWGLPEDDLPKKPKYLVTFTVGVDQMHNVDAAVKKFSDNFTILLFHYDGETSEWDEFEWSSRAIHVSVRRQTKWWYAKRFLHPDIAAPYDYIFIWDEDLGVEHFDSEEYIKLVRKHGLEISQPALDPSSKGLTWMMTKRIDDVEVHKKTLERKNWCPGPDKPPCAAFVEIMAPVFSRDAWRCVWHMIQNDLVHGWGFDFTLQKCVEPADEKIGVVDAQWIVHQSIPTLANQGQRENGKSARQGVRERCEREWKMLQQRFTNAENDYYNNRGINMKNNPL